MFKKSHMSNKESIPKVIHKVLYTHDYDNRTIEQPMKDAIETFVNKNPDYVVKIYNQTDSINYIRDNFGEKMVNIYLKLKPYAFRSDLFRYLVLFNEGGYYSDIKEVALLPFDEVFPSNMRWFSSYDIHEGNIFNALIASIPGHPWLKRAIDMVVTNVTNNYYGDGPLFPTGPKLLYDACDDNNKTPNDIIGKHFRRGNKYYIALDDKKIVQTKYDYNSWDGLGGNDYVKMWGRKDVYN